MTFTNFDWDGFFDFLRKSVPQNEGAMQYKIGDRVRVRRWDVLVKVLDKHFDRFPVGKESYYRNSLSGVRIYFSEAMKPFCGAVLTIAEIDGDMYRCRLENSKDILSFAWIDDFFEGLAFCYGDEIEVSDNGEHWLKQVYVGFVDGSEFPYRTDDFDSFQSSAASGTLRTSCFRKARRLDTACCNGKEVEIDGKKYKLVSVE